MPLINTAVALLQNSRAGASVVNNAMRPLLVGAQAALHRNRIASERAASTLGAYSSSADLVVGWPGKTANSVIDLPYTKLFGDDVKLRYFKRAVAADSHLVTAVSGYPNRIKAATLSFKTNINSSGTFARNAAFYDRDVQVGDFIKIKGTVSAVDYTLSTKVNGLIPTIVAGSIGSVTADASNPTAQSASTASAQTAGTVNDVDIASVSGTSYDGRATGDINEVYTLVVTTAGAPSTARLSCTSASGRDNVASITPAAFSSPTTIGTRGLTATFGHTSDNFVLGQTWTVTVHQLYVVPTVTASGTLSNSAPTTTYIVTVTLGGAIGGSTAPQITVSTTTGADRSGPTNVSATATDVAIGTYGVNIQFSSASLVKGVVWYVPVTASHTGSVTTLALEDSLPAGLIPATDMEISLYIVKQNYPIPRLSVLDPSVVHWVADAVDGITVNDGMTLTESTWTDAGVALAIPVESATLFVEYREWLTTRGGEVIPLTNPTFIPSILGVVDRDNPLAWAASRALGSTGAAVLGQDFITADSIYVSPLGGDPAGSLDLWDACLESAEGRDEIFYMVPLTYRKQVHQRFITHCEAQSQPEISRPRACIVPLTANVTQDIRVTDDTQGTILATIIQNPAIVSTSFTRVYNVAGNAKWLDAGVIAGDFIRYNFATDANGVVTWNEYKILDVPAQDILTLEAGPSIAFSTGRRIEVFRKFSRTQFVADLKAQALEFNSDKVRCLFPEMIDRTTPEPAYYGAAALAGFTSGLLPQQALINAQIPGFDGARSSFGNLPFAQLEDLGEHGVTVVASSDGGVAYIQNFVTATSSVDFDFQDESVRRIVAQVTKWVRAVWEPLYGRVTTTDATIVAMQNLFRDEVIIKTQQTTAGLLGPSFDSLILTSLRKHAVLKNRLVATLTLVPGYNLKAVDITVVI